MHVTSAHMKGLARLRRDASKQLRGIMRVEPVQCSTQTIIGQICCLDARSQQMLNRLVGKEL
jgi:hypothetical protein